MYRIPKDERLIDAIFTVMYRNHQIRSQSELTRLVRKELEKDNEDYRVSGERIRVLAIRKGLATICIDLHEIDDTGLSETCPVCKSPMDPIRNMTIYGDSVEMGRKCTTCPYSVGVKRRIPSRYVFTRQRK